MHNTKKFTLTIAWLVFFVMTCCVLVPQVSWAASTDAEVVLVPGEDGVSVSLELPDSVMVDASALQIGLQVQVKSGELQDISFAFSDSVQSKVKEYRYDRNTGALTLYLAGGQGLLDSKSFNLGLVEVQGAHENGVRISVSTSSESIKVVNGAREEESPLLIAEGKPVEMIVGNGGVAPAPPLPDGGDTPQTPDEGDLPPAPEAGSDTGAASSKVPSGYVTSSSLGKTGDFSLLFLLAISGVTIVSGGILLISRCALRKR